MEMRGKPQQRIYGLKSYIDYKTYMKTFWKQAVLEKLRSSKETFNLVRDFLVDEIRETTGKRINELKDYFYNVEGYNQRIASADMAYLEGKYANYMYFQKITHKLHAHEIRIIECVHETLIANQKRLHPVGFYLPIIQKPEKVRVILYFRPLAVITMQMTVFGSES